LDWIGVRSQTFVNKVTYSIQMLEQGVVVYQLSIPFDVRATIRTNLLLSTTHSLPSIPRHALLLDRVALFCSIRNQTSSDGSKRSKTSSTSSSSSSSSSTSSTEQQPPPFPYNRPFIAGPWLILRAASKATKSALPQDRTLVSTGSLSQLPASLTPLNRSSSMATVRRDPPPEQIMSLLAPSNASSESWKMSIMLVTHNSSIAHQQQQQPQHGNHHRSEPSSPVVSPRKLASGNQPINHLHHLSAAALSGDSVRRTSSSTSTSPRSSQHIEDIYHVPQLVFPEHPTILSRRSLLCQIFADLDKENGFSIWCFDFTVPLADAPQRIPYNIRFGGSSPAGTQLFFEVPASNAPPRTVVMPMPPPCIPLIGKAKNPPLRENSKSAWSHLQTTMCAAQYNLIVVEVC